MHSLGITFDKETKVLTVTGGVRYDTDVSTTLSELCQSKLYEENSKWHNLPDLPYNVFAPVLVSNHGDLYVDLCNSSTECAKLLISKGDKDWSRMDQNEKTKPLHPDIGGRGVMLFKHQHTYHSIWKRTGPAI